MRLTEEQLDRWENPPRKPARKKKNIIVQYRSGPEDKESIHRFLASFYKNWSTFGKYTRLADAAKALRTVAKKNHIFHNYQFRVLVKGEHILKGHMSAEQLADYLMLSKEPDEN